FFFQAEDGIRDRNVTGVQTCALPICEGLPSRSSSNFSAGVDTSIRSVVVVIALVGSFISGGNSGPLHKLVYRSNSGIELLLVRKIGRASCRERGENTGGAGAVKRKSR